MRESVWTLSARDTKRHLLIKELKRSSFVYWHHCYWPMCRSICSRFHECCAGFYGAFTAHFHFVALTSAFTVQTHPSCAVLCCPVLCCDVSVVLWCAVMSVLYCDVCVVLSCAVMCVLCCVSCAVLSCAVMSVLWCRCCTVLCVLWSVSCAVLCLPPLSWL